MRMKEYFEIIRPINCLMFFLTGLFSCYITIKNIGVFLDNRALLGSFSLFLICAGGHAINDYFDVKIDKINKPMRVLPSGRLEPKNVMIFSMILLLISIVISSIINLNTLLLSLIMCILTILYGKYSKMSKIFGNVIISLIVSLILVYAIFITGKMFPIVWIIPVAFFISMSREITKDIEDVKGDKSISKSSLPLKFGIRGSSIFAFLFLLLALIFAYIPYFFSVFNYRYFLVLLVNLIISIYTSKKFLRQPQKNVKMYQKFIKLWMILGLIAILVG
jgi:geranylgeranylglycerol-phosphate geranylgeranyltransferase